MYTLEVTAKFTKQHVCHACGSLEGELKGMPYVQKEDAWFCEDCWQQRPASEIEHLVSEVALRGVPL